MVSHEKPGEGHGEPRRVMRARRPWDNKGGGEPGEPTKGPWVSQGPPGKRRHKAAILQEQNPGGKARNKIQKDFVPNGEEHELTTRPGGERVENTSHWGEEENI